MTGTVLVVDDNRKVFESLEPNFRHFGLVAIHAADRKEAMKHLSTADVHVVLLDIRLGSENGVAVLADIRQREPGIPVIMITGFGSVDSAVQAMKLGAYDYVKKPLDFERLFKVVENALELRRLSSENRELKKRLQEITPPLCLENRRVHDLVDNARKLAQTDIPVLITGENGSGKELVADFIHRHSGRNSHKMNKINCAAFPESLLDNELFGHEKGAYTGAGSTFAGVFERADQGTLFLDEIGDMPLTIQAKILRVLQNKEIRRIGGTSTVSIDVRFIAATNQDLASRMQDGLFREDLFFRLNTAIIHVPPLRDRVEDISPLACRFLEEFSGTHDKEVTAIAPEVLSLFQGYHWPGNIRELKNTINYAVAMASGDTITIGDLPSRVTGQHATMLPARGRREETERHLVATTLSECQWNKKRAAEVLGVSRKTLYAKIERYGITR